MQIRHLSPRELPGLAQVGEATLGPCFLTAKRLAASPRAPRLVTAVIAGDEIVAAALADLTREDGVRVARIRRLAAFLGDEEVNRRLKCALVMSLQATFQRFRATRLEIWTDQDDDLARMILRRLGYPSVSEERRTGPDKRLRRLRLVRPFGGEGGSGRACSGTPPSATTVTWKAT